MCEYANRCAALALVAGSALAVHPPARAGVPIDAAWLNAANGFWNTAANWDIAQVPNNAGMTEYNAFITVAGATYTADLDVDVLLNNLTIDSPLGEATLRLNAFNLDLNTGLNASNNNIIQGDGAGVLTLATGSVSTFTTVRFMNVAQVQARGTVHYAGAGDEFCDTDIDHGGDTDVSGPGTVILNGNSIFKVTTAGTLTLNNANSITTTMGAPSIVNDGLIVRATDPGAFTISGVPTANNGTIRVAEGTLLFSGLAAVLTNSGTLDIDAAKTLELASGAALSNFSAGTLTGGIYTVKGTLRFDTGGTGIDTIDADITLDGTASSIQNADTSDALANTDTIAAAGKLTLLGSRDLTTGGNFDNQGTVSIDPGSTFEVPMGSTLNNYDNTTARTLTGGRFEIRGTGQLRFDAGPMGIDTIDSELIINAPDTETPVRDSAGADALTNLDTIADNGLFEIDGGFTFDTAGSFTVAPNGRLTIGTDSIFEIPNTGGNQLVNFGGNVISDGSFEVRGILRAPGLAVQTIGLVGNPSQITLDSQLFDGMDPVPHFQDNTLPPGMNDAFSQLDTIETGSSLTLANGAMLNITGDLTVKGTLNVTGSGPGPLRGSTLPSSLSVAGNLNQESGAFVLGGGALTLGGNFLLGASATLAGTGNITFTTNPRGTEPGHLAWNGTVAPGAITGDVTATLDINGSLAIAPDAQLRIDLGGLVPGDSYDQLRLTGLADLDGPGRGANLGELHISLVQGFLPALGDAFDVMLFASHEGRFNAYLGMTLPNGLRLEPLWNSDRLTLVVVPAPQSIAAFATLLLARRRRSR